MVLLQKKTKFGTIVQIINVFCYFCNRFVSHEYH